ncbi:ribosome small subunit-dependent GTPase A [Psychrosphaera sp. B3R10]|uniref:ribosome small subunit-dependent GTPase A n=1 Tax=unclassified Psychrosphaera TaxID=2641570 RepID=UPI001C09322D|nr:MULTISPECIES: ribosome small subunit-dependent GTPase A [unclassified Psychrosphaera]MBU2880532.1 ribosome small subunit-dependent GTPase A [Psychrosphaera sp. I2R16]MBU2989147.1 ribosome small subunit-dependent GTPase A [Psychrosphaera sp. B3R10]
MSSSSHLNLQQLGWRPFFQQQINLDEYDTCLFCRVVEQHRSKIVVESDQGQFDIRPSNNADPICVGDWLLINKTTKIIERSLERQSVFQRKSPGSKVDTQLIAANIDHLIIVSSLNQDFNLSRIERYIAVAKDAMVDPIVVLTKADLCENNEEVTNKIHQVQDLDAMMVTLAVNALAYSDLEQLTPYCKLGQTIAFVGSSGVGKSTIVNTLLQTESMKTGSIREDDAKGRHTTTHRALKSLPQGGLLMDTPGIRELQLTECETGVNETFSEIVALAKQCRFSDCSHQTEPGCAVQRSLANGELDPRRFNNFQKLIKEQAFNSATLAERKEKDRNFGKLINAVQNESRLRKKGF